MKTNNLRLSLPPKDYFRQCQTQEDYHTMDLSDYGTQKWPKTFPSSWREHVVLARINRKMGAKSGK